jgi:hypothetical protein
MHVLVVAPYAINTPHFETSLEIVQRHIDSGDSVSVVVCNSSIPTCQVNVDHNLKTCIKCIERKKKGLERIEGEVSTYPILNLRNKDRERLEQLPGSFSSQGELENFQIGDFDAGMGVLSSIISTHRTPTINPRREETAREIRERLHTAVAVYFSSLNYIDSLQPDRVYAFNGRFAIQRAVFRASHEKGVDCFLHERGGGLNRFEIYENAMPHDRTYVTQQIHQYWNEAPSDKREEEARRFYEERAEGEVTGWFSFTKEQESDNIPNSFDSTKHNIAVYPSSEDEFAAIGEEWQNPIYENQLAGIRRIARALAPQEGIEMYVRVHPNLTGVENKQTQGLDELSILGCTIIPPDSEVSSYALLEAADTVLTFGSTMGIEATYWRKPSVLAGVSLYGDLGGTYNPDSHASVVRLLKRRELDPRPIKPSLMYGYYQRRKGTRFRHFKADDVFSGDFKGKPILDDPSLVYRVGNRLFGSSKLRPITNIISTTAREWNRHNVGVKS